MRETFKRHWFTATVLIGLGILAFLILRPQTAIGLASNSAEATSYVPEGWAMEGHDPARTRFINYEVPLPFEWQYRLLVGGNTEAGSPPVVAAGTLLVETEGRLLAIDPLSGAERWAYENDGQFISPAVAGNRVYIRVESGDSGSIQALNLRTGRRIWQWRPYRLSSPETSHLGGHLTSPVVVDGMVFVGAGQEVYALNAASGRERWRFHASDYIASSVSVAEGRVYISDLSNFYCLDQATGQVLWRHPTAITLYFAPVVAGQMVLVSDGDQVVALDTLSGEELWATNLPDVRLIPAGANDSLVFIKSTSTLYALDPATGNVRWQFGDANYVSLPAIDSRTLFAVTGQGPGTAVAVVDLATGEPHWLAIESLANSAPVIASDTLYLRTTNGQVVALCRERSEQAGDS